MDGFNIYESRVRAHQTDVNGAMYHAAYLDLYDDARIETFRRLGYDYARMSATGIRPVIRRIESDYLTPAFMDELLTVSVTVVRMTTATLTLRYDCRRDGEGISVGHATFAFVSQDGRPVRIPPDLRAVVEASDLLRGAT
ncbi:MAG TPA: thioesterase family protein [Chloroflexota bacterium]|nr:thioesterase family protein [Chloroflexota bacterium]